MKLFRRTMWIGLWLAGALAAAAATGPSQLTVQVRNGQIRNAASYMSKAIADVPYGTTVAVLGAQGAWKQVRTPDGQAGWMHDSALTAQKLTMKAGTGDARGGASATEVSLASKGFTEQIEKEYKDQNKAMDFTWVDRMGKLKVSPDEAQSFLAAGQVRPHAAGGAK